MKNQLNRRVFLKKSLAGTAGALAFPTILPAGVFTAPGRILPNDRINFGLIGVGEMGSGHLRSFIEYDDIRVVAVCDVNSEDAARAVEFTNNRYGSQECVAYNDFRDLLARGDIDAVLIAVPDHWHALIGMEAARQGKHMYYEKPLSLFFRECQAMRQAINRYGVVFQLGTQQRSDERFRFTCELVRNGKLGNLEKMSRW